MKILLIANNYWNFYNFRKELIDKILEAEHEVHLLGNDDDYFAEFKKKNLKLHKIKFSSRKKSIIEDFFLIIKLYKKIKLINPNIILSFTIKANIYSSLISKILDINIINNITGLGSSFLNNKIIKLITIFLYRISLSKSKMVFFQNISDKKLFLKLKIVKESNSKVIPGSGIDTSYFRSNHSLPKDKNIFLFSGRLIKDKGINEYLQAAKLIIDKKNNCEFHIIGKLDKDEKSSIKETYLNSYLRNKKIKYFGFVKNLKQYYANSSCVILPSYREGLSRSLLEAASMSRPIITTNVPGCQDLVQENENGFLTEVKNVDSLVKAINTFINLSYANKQLMAKSSRNIAQNKFQINIVISNYLKKIRELE